MSIGIPAMGPEYSLWNPNNQRPVTGVPFFHCSLVIKRYLTLISCLVEEPNAKDDNDLNLRAMLKFLSAQCYFILQLSVEAIGSLK